jgi:hypothetical protein
LIYLISTNYIYIKYFKSAIAYYSTVNEIINEYSDGVITNPCQINNNIVTEDIIENSATSMDVGQLDDIGSSNYSNIETYDDHELEDGDDDHDEDTVYLV